MRTEGMTLLEMLAIIIIIGILAAIALPNFAPVREKALDKEASASLKLIQAAEKIYRMETDFYYPYSTGTTVTETNITYINQYLKLNLPETNQKWDYTCTSTSPTACAYATRSNDPTKQWHLGVSDTGEPTSGACP